MSELNDKHGSRSPFNFPHLNGQFTPVACVSSSHLPGSAAYSSARSSKHSCLAAAAMSCAQVRKQQPTAGAERAEQAAARVGPEKRRPGCSRELRKGKRGLKNMREWAPHATLTHTSMDNNLGRYSTVSCPHIYARMGHAFMFSASLMLRGPTSHGASALLPSGGKSLSPCMMARRCWCWTWCTERNG